MAAFDPRYYGIPPSQQILTENRYPYTATASQTTFAAIYTIGYVDVYYNGAHLDPRFAFTAANGTTVVLTTPADAGASVIIVARPQVPVNNVYSQTQVNNLVQNYYANTTAGTASALTATTTPSFASWVDGMEVKVRMSAANTVTAPTIAFNGLTGVTIVRDGQQALTIGDWSVSDEVTLRYDIAANNLTLMTGKLTAISPAVGDNSNKPATTSWINPLAANGQCRLSVASATSLLLSPYNGQCLNIGGTVEQIPTAGVTISNTGLVASTLYYVYSSMVGAVMTLVLSTTGHSTAPNGIQTQTGNTALTLVGMIYTNASSQFVDAPTTRYCLNWFNRRTLMGFMNANTGVATISASFIEMSTTWRVGFLSWGDEAIIALASMESATTVVAGAASYTAGISIDLIANIIAIEGATSVGAGYGVPITPVGMYNPTEGVHFTTIIADVSGAQTLMLNIVYSSVAIRG